MCEIFKCDFYTVQLLKCSSGFTRLLILNIFENMLAPWFMAFSD
jgi:hypothetical protein